MGVRGKDADIGVFEGDDARVVTQFHGDLAEAGVLDALKGGHGHIRVREQRVVGGVEPFGAELEVLAFRDAGLLD